jgi:hypothetical protein
VLLKLPNAYADVIEAQTHTSARRKTSQCQRPRAPFFTTCLVSHSLTWCSAPFFLSSRPSSDVQVGLPMSPVSSAMTVHHAPGWAEARNTPGQE